MRVSAKADYAIRAAVELARAEPGARVKASAIAAAQDIPPKFLETILQALRHAGIVDSTRGPQGGHVLARPAAAVTVADVIRAVEGPLAAVAGRPPEELEEGALHRADATRRGRDPPRLHHRCASPPRPTTRSALRSSSPGRDRARA